MEDIIAGVIVFVGILIIALLFSLVLAFPMMWLWNWLMPHLFGLSEITFWEMFGLSLLIKLIFPTGSSSTKN